MLFTGGVLYLFNFAKPLYSYGINRRDTRETVIFFRNHHLHLPCLLSNLNLYRTTITIVFV